MIRWIAGGVMAAAGAGYVFLNRNKIIYPTPESLIITPDTEIVVERQEGGDVIIRWQDAERPALIYPSAPGHITRDWILEGTGEVRVTNLKSDERYTFRIVYKDDPQNSYTVAERVLNIDGIANFRDIGGYPAKDGRHVKWNKVYRSGRLSEVSEAGWAYLNKLGIRLICDLRSKEEKADDPNNLPEDLTFEHAHLPLNDSQSTAERLFAILFNRRRLVTLMVQAYCNIMIDKNAPLFGDILTRLAHEDNLPAIIHCTAGKDRTGISIALLLLLLGVPDEIVIADYTLSNHYYQMFQSYTAKMIEKLNFLKISVDDLFPLLVADGEIMRKTIAHIRSTYGTVEDYLITHAGMEFSTIERLREILLE